MIREVPGIFLFIHNYLKNFSSQPFCSTVSRTIIWKKNPNCVNWEIKVSFFTRFGWNSNNSNYTTLRWWYWSNSGFYRFPFNHLHFLFSIYWRWYHDISSSLSSMSRHAKWSLTRALSMSLRESNKVLNPIAEKVLHPPYIQKLIKGKQSQMSN